MQRHPGEISPGESFDLFYFLRNPFDANTYFAQAKIYDLRTGEVLLTTALDQAATNSRLFIKTVQAPADSTGIGRSIAAIATLYTDSGYTTKSSDYEEQEQYFLIKAAIPFVGTGGGVDYVYLREMLQEIVDASVRKLPKPESVEIPEMPFAAVLGAIGALQREINRIPKDAPDLATVHARLDDLSAAIGNIPQPEKIDLMPMAQTLGAMLRAVKDLKEAVDTTNATVSDAISRECADFLQEAMKKFEAGLKDLMSRQELTIPLHSIVQEKQPPPSPIDVRHLM